MNRRAFLSALGAALSGSLAGCIGEQVRQLDETVSVGAGTLRLVDATATRILPTRGPVHNRVNGGDNEQYILFWFDVSGLSGVDAQEYVRSNLQLSLGRFSANRFGGGTPVNRPEGDNLVAAIFEVSAPINIPDDAQLEWSGEEERVWDAAGIMQETGVTTYAAAPPSFDVIAFSAERVDDSTATATVRVSNDTLTTGTFHALLGSAALSDQPLRSFEVSGREVAEQTYDLQLYKNGAEETVRLTWGEESRTATVSPAAEN